MTALKILSVALIAVGAIINYAAGLIVDRLKIAQRISVKEAGEFEPESLEKYKRMKAMSIVKLAGFVILFPGVILIFIAYR